MPPCSPVAANCSTNPFASRLCTNLGASLPLPLSAPYSDPFPMHEYAGQPSPRAPFHSHSHAQEFQADTICLRLSTLARRCSTYMTLTSAPTPSKHCVCYNLRTSLHPSSAQHSEFRWHRNCTSPSGREASVARPCTCIYAEMPGNRWIMPGIRLRHLIRRKVANFTAPANSPFKSRLWRFDPTC
jgi:hypothetical protein